MLGHHRDGRAALRSGSRRAGPRPRTAAFTAVGRAGVRRRPRRRSGRPTPGRRPGGRPAPRQSGTYQAYCGWARRSASDRELPDVGLGVAHRAALPGGDHAEPQAEQLQTEVAEGPADVDDLGRLGVPQVDVVGSREGVAVGGQGRAERPQVAGLAGQGRRRRSDSAGMRPASSVNASPTASRAIRCTRRTGSPSPSASRASASRSFCSRSTSRTSNPPSPAAKPNAASASAVGVAGPTRQVGRLAVEHPGARRGRPRRAAPRRRRAAAAAGGVVDRHQVEGLRGRAGPRPPRPGRRARRGPPPRSRPRPGPGRRGAGPAAGARPPRRGAGRGRRPPPGAARGAARPAWRRTRRLARARATARDGRRPAGRGRLATRASRPRTRSSWSSPARARTRLEGGFGSEHRGDGEHELGRLREPGDAAADRALRGVGDHLGDRRAAGRGEPGHLRDEERVAGRALTTAAASSGPTRCPPVAAIRAADVVDAEAGERPGLPRGGDLGRQQAAVRARGDLVVAPPADHEHRTRREAGQQEPQQVQAARVGPVEVVEQQHHRELRGQPVEHRLDAVEEREPVHRRSGRARRRRGRRARRPGGPADRRG